MEDKNQAAIIKCIEDQINLCEKIESKLEVIMKKKKFKICKWSN